MLKSMPENIDLSFFCLSVIFVPKVSFMIILLCDFSTLK